MGIQIFFDLAKLYFPFYPLRCGIYARLDIWKSAYMIYSVVGQLCSASCHLYNQCHCHTKWSDTAMMMATWWL